jgi:hypothetical protein
VLLFVVHALHKLVGNPAQDKVGLDGAVLKLGAALWTVGGAPAKGGVALLAGIRPVLCAHVAKAMPAGQCHWVSQAIQADCAFRAFELLLHGVDGGPQLRVFLFKIRNFLEQILFCSLALRVWGAGTFTCVFALDFAMRWLQVILGCPGLQDAVDAEQGILGVNCVLHGGVVFFCVYI